MLEKGAVHDTERSGDIWGPLMRNDIMTLTTRLGNPIEEIMQQRPLQSITEK